MLRKITGAAEFLIALGAAEAAVDWLWLHGVGIFFWFMERGADYLMLVAISIEIYLILILTWKLTKWDWIYRWLMRASWLLPSYLYAASLCRSLSTDSRRVHSQEDFFVWQTAIILRSQEIYAARAIPILGIFLILLCAILERKANAVRR